MCSIVLLHNKRERLLSVFLVLGVLLCGGTASAVPVTPVYTVTYGDAVTGDNQFLGSDGKHHWTIDAGADSYQNDAYERPTVQTFATTDGKYATKDGEYFGNLDIVQAQTGRDDQYFYVAIDLFSTDKVTSDNTHTVEGLIYEYGFRLSTDPNGAGGLLLISDQPLSKNGTTYGLNSTFGYEDTNGDVGGTGLTVTKEDNPGEVSGNGYENKVISDGKLGSTEVLFSRVSPTDPTVVEFALDYKALGFTESQMDALAYLVFQSIKGGPKDPANYLWNDEYTKSEAGSPNPGAGGLSEFGTQGTGNIYELDTLRASSTSNPVPEPSTLLLLGSGLVGLGLLRRRKRSRV